MRRLIGINKIEARPKPENVMDAVSVSIPI